MVALGTLAFVDPTKRFAEVMGQPEEALPLDEAALLIAAQARPDLDVAEELDRLDRLAAGVPAPTLDALRRHLFVELGFTGNQADYHDPANSYLDQVMVRRVGIPISLSVLLMEVARRRGVPMVGVSMPGHFLVRHETGPEEFVDPFARGEVLDQRGCEERFRSVHGPTVVFKPDFLAPVSKRSIVARMLANLDGIATARADWTMLAWVARLRAAMPAASGDEHRRLASVLAGSYRFDEAADVLERLASSQLDAVGGDDLAAARLYRARLN